MTAAVIVAVSACVAASILLCRLTLFDFHNYHGFDDQLIIDQDDHDGEIFFIIFSACVAASILLCRLFDHHNHHDYCHDHDDYHDHGEDDDDNDEIKLLL